MKAIANIAKRRWFCSCVLAGMMAGPLQAKEDVLNAPSIKSDLAVSNLLIDVAQAGSRIVAVGSRGHILYSDNRGTNWTQASVPVSVLLTAVHFADDKHGFAVGHSGVILKTTDGGATWKKMFDGNDANVMVIQQVKDYVASLEREVSSMEAKKLGLENEDEIIALEEELDEMVYQLEEAQFGVEDAEADAEVGASKPFLDVYALSPQEVFVSGAYGFLFKSEDGGKTWSNYGDRMDNVDRFHLNSITKISSGELLLVGEAGVIFRSTDDGESWESIYSPYEGSFFGVLGTGDDGVALAYGLRGNLFRSEDGGVNWEKVDTETQSSLMSGSTDGYGGITIVGNSGVVIASKDGGKSFSAKIREDRQDLASALIIRKNKMVVVGESGVKIVGQDGLSL